MRFRLGESKRDRDIRLNRWHWWFAWHPVRLAYRDDRGDRGGVWMEWIIRSHTKGVSEYRPPGEVGSWIYNPVEVKFPSGNVIKGSS